MSMHKILADVAAVISGLLERELPQAGKDWWQSCVVDRLSIQQQRLVAQAARAYESSFAYERDHRSVVVASDGSYRFTQDRIVRIQTAAGVGDLRSCEQGSKFVRAECGAK